MITPIRTQDDAGLNLKERIATVLDENSYIIGTDLIPEPKNSIDQIVVSVQYGNVSRPRLTPFGSSAIYHFDVAIYRSTRRRKITDEQFRALIATAERQISNLVDTEGGNVNGWNSLDYDAESTNDQLADAGGMLMGLRVIPLTITVHG